MRRMIIIVSHKVCSENITKIIAKICPRFLYGDFAIKFVMDEASP